MLFGSLFALAFAFLNRARGSKLFDLTTSTTASRLASTFGMGLLAGMLAYSWAVGVWAWATLLLWSLPGWGKYAGAAIGVGLDPEEKEFTPVDWIMTRLPIKNERLWGAVAMSLRMTLAAPSVLGASFLANGEPLWALLVPVMGLVYLPCGLLFKARGWEVGEYCAGAVLGALIFLSIAPTQQLV